MYIVFHRDKYFVLRTPPPTHLNVSTIIHSKSKLQAARCKGNKTNQKKKGLDFSKVRPSVCLMKGHEDFDFLPSFFFLFA